MIGNIYEIIVFSDFLLPMILKNIFLKSCTRNAVKYPQATCVHA